MADATEIPAPEWCVPGARVMVQHREAGWSVQTIAKVHKRYCTLEAHGPTIRYSLLPDGSVCHQSRERWSFPTHVYAWDSPEGEAGRRALAAATRRRRIRTLVETWLRDNDVDHLRQALPIIRRVIAAAEQPEAAPDA